MLRRWGRCLGCLRVKGKGRRGGWERMGKGRREYCWIDLKGYD